MAFRLNNFQAVVEHDGSTHYMNLVSATINSAFPFSQSPAANIVLTTDKTSLLSFDDIIRIRVSLRTGEDQHESYQNIFEGRIVNLHSTPLAVTLECRGHEEELFYTTITSDYTKSSGTTGTILSEIVDAYLTRLTDAASSYIDTTGSTTITNINYQQDTKVVADAVMELETLEGEGYIFGLETVYNENLDTLTAVYVSWQTVDTTVTTLVSAYQGNNNIIDYQFSSIGENVLNDFTQYGASGTPQIVGTASDAGSKTSYNSRYYVNTDKSISTTDMAGDLVTALKNRWYLPVKTGSVLVHGVPIIKPGGLLYCYFPDVYIEGELIDGNYRITRVQHDINSTSWTTRLDIGEKVDTVSETIAKTQILNRRNNANLID